MPDQIPNQPAAPPPAPGETPAPDPNVELNQLRQKVNELQTREGRFRNEKGVMQARIRELEALALGNDTGTPDPGRMTATEAQQYGYQLQYQPQYQAPPQQDVVTREEWDLDRFKREQPNRFDAVRQIALDSAKVSNYIRYRQGPYGQAVPDVYGTYQAIAQSLELEELRKAQAGANPNRNPALGVISGNGAASTPEVVDIQDKTPEQLKEMFPEAFAPGGQFGVNR